jgi:predicted O-methyltransferase YrrM
MPFEINQSLPSAYQAILDQTIASGFTMASDVLTCSLLRTLAAAKPAGRFLELGTGTGLATAWILDGMDSQSIITSIDNDRNLLSIAESHLGDDKRLDLICTDGGDWISSNSGFKYDYIFADTWHGKYLMLEEVLDMLNLGGFYILDDMLPQANWPEGHDEKASRLARYLDERSDLFVTQQHWATGIIVAVKRNSN